MAVLLGGIIKSCEGSMDSSGVASSGRYLPEKLCSEILGFDLLETAGKISLQHGRPGEERLVDPYTEMRDLLRLGGVPEGMDELELRELCGFFGLVVSEFKSLYSSLYPTGAFIEMLLHRSQIEKEAVEEEDEYMFSPLALAKIDARSEKFKAVLGGFEWG